MCAKPVAELHLDEAPDKTYTYTDTSTVADPVSCPITDWEWTFVDMGNLKSNVPEPGARHVPGTTARTR